MKKIVVVLAFSQLAYGAGVQEASYSVAQLIEKFEELRAHTLKTERMVVDLDGNIRELRQESERLSKEVTMPSVALKEVIKASGFTDQCDPDEVMKPTEKSTLGAVGFNAFMVSDASWSKIRRLEKEVALLRSESDQFKQQLVKLEEMMKQPRS